MRTFLLIGIFYLALGCAASSKSDKSPEIVPAIQQPVPAKTLNVQLENLTKQIASDLSKKSKIAVIEFSNLQGQTTELGRYLAEELITRLYQTKKFEVIERQLLNKVMREHQLNFSGLVDPGSAKELGRILGVDAIATGTVTDLGNSIKINARLISTETGEIFSVASVSCVKDDVVQKLLGESIRQDGPGFAPSGVTNSAGPGDVQAVDEVNDLRFELTGCEKNDRTVTCWLYVTNTTEDDRDLILWFRETKIFDQAGSEYSVCKVKIANSSSRPNPECDWGGSARLEKMVIPGVRTPIELVFEKVSSDANQISLLQISLGHVGSVKFRNISLM